MSGLIEKVFRFSFIFNCATLNRCDDDRSIDAVARPRFSVCSERDIDFLSSC